MRILLVHNHYRRTGGEDGVVAAEERLLRAAGHTVDVASLDNDGIESVGSRIETALFTPWSPSGRRFVDTAIRRFHPDLVHVHNTFPRLSPSIFAAARAAGVPTVATLHNFRLVCAGALLMRDGAPCMDCIGRSPWPAIAHRCYRGSVIGSAAVAAGIALHRRLGTWTKAVARFVIPSRFARDRFVEAGLPPERLVVKPNFVADPGEPDPTAPRVGALYVGRLSTEKGVTTLVEAWRGCTHPLTVVGDGPEADALRARAAGDPNIRFLGALPPAEVLAHMRAAAVLVLPSVCHENHPLVACEAMASGLPIAASDIGALSTLIHAGDDGVHFRPGDPVDLARAVLPLLDDPAAAARMGRAARERWRTDFSPERNLAHLEAIYRDVLAEAGTAPERRP